MCGIHGVLSTSTTARSSLGKFVENAFIANAVRGMDSSGMFQIDRKGYPWVHKLALPGPFFIDNKLTKAFLADVGSSVATVCHVRAATQGKVNIDNAHPFVAAREDGNRVIGVHNGTLTAWQSRKHANLFNVDSEWAINRIAQEGADAFEEFTGSYAFVWWCEANPSVVYMARNKDRPLHFMLTPDQENLLFASEPGMLSWLAEKNFIKARDEAILVLEEGKLYTFDLSQKTISWSKSNLPEGKYPVSSTSSSTSGTGYSGSYPYATGSYSTSMRGQQEEFVDDDIPFDRLPERAINLITSLRLALETADVAGEVQEEGTNGTVLPPRKLSRRERKQQRNQERKQDSCGDGDFCGDLRQVPDQYFSYSSASSQERNIAKAKGLYGQMLFFVGLMYDEEYGDCYGEIEDYVAGTGKVRYDAVIRDLTKSEAHNKYINSERLTHVVCIGQVPDDDSMAGTIVVTPLSKEGIDKFAKALS